MEALRRWKGSVPPFDAAAAAAAAGLDAEADTIAGSLWSEGWERRGVRFQIGVGTWKQAYVRVYR